MASSDYTGAIMSMGFPERHAHKALAATGHRGVDHAVNWLVRHERDPTLKDDIPREYIVYLRPLGELKDLIDKFRKDSSAACNGGRCTDTAFDFHPHVALCRYFQVGDALSVVLPSYLRTAVQQWNPIKGPLDWSLRCADNSIILQLSSKHSNALGNLMARYIALCADQQIFVERSDKNPHISLAYGFKKENFEVLKHLAETIVNPRAACRYEICLYSRDSRMRLSRVFRVVKTYKPHRSDELKLTLGDFMYVSDEDFDKSRDGWYYGISWLTGCLGKFPGTYTVQTAAMDAWTLHEAIPLSSLSSEDVQIPPTLSPAHLRAHRPPSPPLQRLFVVRHGERVDQAFGRDWYGEPRHFTDSGKYIRSDGNLPELILDREFPSAWALDTPLTRTGEFQAECVGECLGKSGIRPVAVYTSCSYRCILTAHHIIKGIEKSHAKATARQSGHYDSVWEAHSCPTIRIEPGLLEWLGWPKKDIGRVPTFFKPKQFQFTEISVDASYRPLYNVKQLPNHLDETLGEMYKRNGDAIQRILNLHSSGDILIVAHACTLDVAYRTLTFQKPPEWRPFLDILWTIPYVAVTEMDRVHGTWRLTEPPKGHSFTQAKNAGWNWKALTTDDSPVTSLPDSMLSPPSSAQKKKPKAPGFDCGCPKFAL